MKRTTIYLFIVLVGAGVTACSSSSPSKWNSDTVAVENSQSSVSAIDSLVFPYREGLKDEMNEVIGYCPQDLEKARPCSPLNNWAADALYFEYKEKLDMNSNCLVLLNVGGLRSRFNKGRLSVGDIYSFMPFDNNVVVVRMPMSALPDIERYLVASGGEPIANARLIGGKLIFSEQNTDADEFIILTSDYLANGGDKMTFFEKSLEKTDLGDLLRDVFLNQVKAQDTLKIDNTCRIHVD